MMPGFRHHNRKNKAEAKGERCFFLNSSNNHSSTTDKILLPSGIASYSADVTWKYRRRPFVGELLAWGGGAVVDLSVEPAVAGSIGGSVFPAASAGMMAGAHAAAGTRGAATSAPAVAGDVGGSVFPTESARMMTGAPVAAGSRGAAASAPAVAGGFGRNVFPAESAGMMAGASVAAGSRGAAPVVASGSGPAESAGMMAGRPAAAGSSGAAFQAASSAVRLPPAVAFASDDHEDCQVRRTATATRRQAFEVTPAMTRSRSRSSSRHDGVSGALAETVRTLDEDDGELPAGPAHLLVTPGTYAHAHAGPHIRIWTEAESKEFEGLSAVGTFVEEGGT